MKRFLTTLSLVIGVSAASYAGVITSANSNLSGSGVTLIDFDSGTVGAIPLGALSSIPFNVGGVGATIVGSGPGTGSAKNSGTQFSLASGNASYYTTTIPGGASLSGHYISTYSQANNQFVNPTNNLDFVHTITITFGGAGVSDFLIDYFGNDSLLNTMTINGVGGASYTTSIPVSPSCGFGATCPNAGLRLGYTTTGDTNGISAITSIVFTFNGLDAGGSSYGGDQVLFDNLRALGLGAGSSSSSSGTGGPGAVPEPSTYALIGTGLAGLAYARRKK